tara:strand:+ start:191 stop:2017 length:1827 start_codon:yes stop_codon:yes gene_type:complete
MCGIFCAINFKRNFLPREKESLIESVKNLSHRGPDNLDYLFNSGKENLKENLFFGHTRLSIIDLDEKSNQPYSDDELTIIFNGEIFNYLELKDELKKLGCHFKTKSDTEVILMSYKFYGINCFKKFNGMWSIIIFDKNKNQIVVSRDRFGIKPLYYTLTDNSLYLSSEIKPLLNQLDDLCINSDLLKYSLESTFYDINNDSYFYNIKKIKSSTYSCIDLNNFSGKLDFKKFWDIKDLKDKYSTLNFKNAISVFQNLLEDAIKIRLRSDVPLVTMLSGGLDSSVISYLASNNFKNTSTFSIISENKNYSEENFIDSLNQKFNFHSTKIIFDPSQMENYLEKTINCQQEPFAGFSIVAQNLLFNKISNTNFKVVLSGQGGDEVLLGYLKYYFYSMKFAFKKYNFSRFFNLIVGAIVNQTIFHQFNFYNAKKYLSISELKPNYIRSYYKKNNRKFGSIKERQILDIENFSIPPLTRYEDRNSMLYGIETRHPFLDHRLVEFALAVKEEHLINSGWNKYILRKSYPEIPKKIRFRKDKIGFQVSHESFLKNELNDMIFDLFNNSKLNSYGIIDDNKFINEFNKFKSNKSMVSPAQFSGTLISEIWARNFIKK